MVGALPSLGITWATEKVRGDLYIILRFDRYVNETECRFAVTKGIVDFLAALTLAYTAFCLGSVLYGARKWPPCFTNYRNRYRINFTFYIVF